MLYHTVNNMMARLIRKLGKEHQSQGRTAFLINGGFSAARYWCSDIDSIDGVAVSDTSWARPETREDQVNSLNDCSSYSYQATTKIRLHIIHEYIAAIA